jgi:hypothetical protein
MQRAASGRVGGDTHVRNCFRLLDVSFGLCTPLSTLERWPRPPQFSYVNRVFVHELTVARFFCGVKVSTVGTAYDMP